VRIFLVRSLPIKDNKPYYMKTLTLILAIMITGAAFSQGPGEVVTFNAEKVNDSVVLTWSPSVSPETNHFEILRSEDGINWRVIALMFPYEDAAVSHSYKYSDKAKDAGTLHYKIRQIDINKKEKFSEVKMIALAGK
jgi:hypothetical protein